MLARQRVSLGCSVGGGDKVFYFCSVRASGIYFDDALFCIYFVVGYFICQWCTLEA